MSDEVRKWANVIAVVAALIGAIGCDSKPHRRATSGPTSGPYPAGWTDLPRRQLADGSRNVIGPGGFLRFMERDHWTGRQVTRTGHTFQHVTVTIVGQNDLQFVEFDTSATYELALRELIAEWGEPDKQHTEQRPWSDHDVGGHGDNYRPGTYPVNGACWNFGPDNAELKSAVWTDDGTKQSRGTVLTVNDAMMGLCSREPWE